jgi:hypothetical protein
MADTLGDEAEVSHATRPEMDGQPLNPSPSGIGRRHSFDGLTESLGLSVRPDALVVAPP